MWEEPNPSHPVLPVNLVDISFWIRGEAESELQTAEVIRVFFNRRASMTNGLDLFPSVKLPDEKQNRSLEAETPRHVAKVA